MYLFLSLVVVVILILTFGVSEPEEFRDVKQKYNELRKHLITTGMFPKLHRQILLCGYTKKSGDIGYNTNKGYEIGLCLDGTVNEIFHVLIHELAHTISTTYDHDTEFWKNMDTLQSICIKIGIYVPIKDKTVFCGSHIGG